MFSSRASYVQRDESKVVSCWTSGHWWVKLSNLNNQVSKSIIVSFIHLVSHNWIFLSLPIKRKKKQNSVLSSSVVVVKKTRKRGKCCGFEDRCFLRDGKSIVD